MVSGTGIGIVTGTARENPGDMGVIGKGVA